MPPVRRVDMAGHGNGGCAKPVGNWLKGVAIGGSLRTGLSARRWQGRDVGGPNDLISPLAVGQSFLTLSLL